MEQSYLKFLSTCGFEKDAGIIGFLFAIPTPKLLKLELEHRLFPEELFRELNYFSDLAEDELWQICERRIRIYKAYKRFLKQLTKT